MRIQGLDAEQTRRLIDSEQRYDVFRATRERLRHSFRGSMHWKTVEGRDYLYHKQAGAAKSLGPRSADTEMTYRGFTEGRQSLETRRRQLDGAIRTAAPVDRAMGLGRVPQAVARILRRLDEHGLLGRGISVVGTNAMFAYERRAGGHFEAGLLATSDVDLLFDARQRLRLIGPADPIEGIGGLLKKVDASFQPIAPGAFRAINDTGLMIDLIQPMPKSSALAPSPGKVVPGDSLHPVEIVGLQWLQNAPQIEANLIDDRGFPLPMAVPDPRAFALHKLWLSERPDRDPAKAMRDRAQAEAVAAIVRDYLPSMRFDGDDLSAIPAELRARSGELLARLDDTEQSDWE